MNRNRQSIPGRAFGLFSILSMCGLLSLMLTASATAEPVPQKLRGDWSLELDSGLPVWMSVVETY